MSNRRRSYKGIGASIGYDNQRTEYSCDGRWHYSAPASKPKRRKRCYACNCEAWMAGMWELFDTLHAQKEPPQYHMEVSTEALRMLEAAMESQQTEASK